MLDQLNPVIDELDRAVQQHALIPPMRIKPKAPAFKNRRLAHPPNLIPKAGPPGQAALRQVRRGFRQVLFDLFRDKRRRRQEWRLAFRL
jgi:hypothetical protein